MRKLLYGCTALLSEFCSDCQAESFVIDGRTVCCGKLALDAPTTWQRMSETYGRRRIPPWLKERIIQEQQSRCFYCERPFAERVFRRSREVKKIVCIDHWEPHAFSADDRPDNLVAACSICNGIKADLMFKDLYECRNYIRGQREAKGYSLQAPQHLLSPLREAIQSNP